MQKFGVFRWHYYSENFADTEYNSPYRFKGGSALIGGKENYVKENMDYVIGVTGKCAGVGSTKIIYVSSHVVLHVIY